MSEKPPPPEKIDDLTFAELRLASKLHKPPGKAMAMAELVELVKFLAPAQTMERFMDGETIEAHMRLLRQQGAMPMLTRVLADMVIQLDRFADLNKIDLAAAIRQRFEEENQRHDMERQRSGT